MMTGEKMIKKMTVLFAGIALFSACSLFASEGKGGQAGSFLRFGSSARSLAMGGAYGTIAEGGDALLFNPAGLGLSERWEFNFMHSQLWLDSRVNYAAFTLPINNWGGFGLGFMNTGTTAIDGRDQFNQPTGEFSAGETAILLGYGKWFMARKFRAGITAKFNMINMNDNSASGLGGFDVGIVSKEVLNRKMRLGLNIQNIGASEIAGDALPMTIRAGLGYKLLRRMYITAEGVMVSGGDFTPHVGAEYRLGRLINLRAGYSGNEVTFGLGLNLDRIVGGTIAGTYPTLDYAASVMNPIDNNFTRFSIAIKGKERFGIEELESIENPCDNLSIFETLLDKDGMVGARANLMFGECYFNYESVISPFDTEHRIKDTYQYFNDAYAGKYGGDWHNVIVVDPEARNLFSQRTHYQYAESRMSRIIDEGTRQLLDKLILAGGDSTAYDNRLQYDLGYVLEQMGHVDSAIGIYQAIARREVKVPERYLAMLRLGELLRDTDKDAALGHLNMIIQNFGWGFYNEDGSRASYSMFPKKYRDNAIVDEALLIRGDILYTKGDTKEALSSYLDIVLFHPDLDPANVREAMDKAAQCYDKLGNSEAAASLRAKLAAMKI
jgi:tetratricopeptide (TPR) repeat protein